MARTIPALVAQLPLVETTAPRRYIRSGETGTPGSWRDEGQSSNLALATGRCGTAFHQWFADGQIVVNDGAPTRRLTYKAIYLSAAHTVLWVGVYGESPTETGEVTFRSSTAGDSVVLALPISADWVSGEITIDPDVLAGEVIEVETEGECYIFGVDGNYLEVTPNNTYPGADDELDAVLVDGARPIDDGETADDEPLDSGLGYDIKANEIAFNSRRRIIFNASGVEGTAHRSLGLYPMRQAVPLLNGTDVYHPIRVHALVDNAEGSTTDFRVYIDRGDGGRSALYEAAGGPGTAKVKVIEVVAESGESWKTLDMFMVPHRAHIMPPTYGGLAQIGVFIDAPDDVLTVLKSVLIEELAE